MADTILTPGEETPSVTPSVTEDYLEKANYLSEFSTEDEQAVVRDNLGVYSKDAVYDKSETASLLNQVITQAIQNHLDTSDPHKILPIVKSLLEGVVYNNGTTPFTSPQSGIDPVKDSDLTTKKFVENLLKEHLNSNDPHKILPQVTQTLKDYVKESQVYLKNQVYTKSELDEQAKQYVLKDGSIPFTKAQTGVDPTNSSHLSTKRYVDQTMQKHLDETDPHNFLSILNNKLAYYAKVANVYTKSQTYSKSQIDSIINQLIQDAAEEAIAQHLSAYDPHSILPEVKKLKYVKQDGSTPFTSRQKGIDAKESQDLVTLHQVEDKVQAVNDSIKKLQPIWVTSGPVQSTVGFLEDNTPVPQSMTLQEVCDAIFYGSGISLSVSSSVIIANTCPVTMCINGSTGLVKIANLYQGDKLIYTFTGEDFRDGCVTVDSEPILEDTTFTFVVTYTNGSKHSESKTVTCNIPIFVGLLPKWKFGYSITMEYLKQLQKQDTAGTQNQFLNCDKDATAVTFKYSFTDPDLRHPFILVPETYPNLESMAISSQKFGKDAFNEITKIPLKVTGVSKEVIFKMYVYKQALSSLNQEVTYNFESR